MGQFSRAGRAEILRAAQKDEEFCNQFKIDLSNFVGDVVGQRLWLTRYNLVERLTHFVYQSCTTLRNLQTLGEEYTGIVQVDNTGRHLPSKLRFTTSIFLDSGGPLILHGIVLFCERALRQQTLPPETKDKLRKFLTAAKVSAPFLQHFHKTLFYLHGDYYHFAKRCTGIHYVLFRSWLKDRESRQAFHWLGIVSAIYLALSVVHTIHNSQAWTKDLTSTPLPTSLSCSDPSLRCSLCLEARTSPSSTPCGHIFCWACIHEWLATKTECPLCREQVVPSRVIYLQNYCKPKAKVADFV